MPLPNFFIIGAPKSGTTALYDTLIQHPEIYMSPVKEPLFFACDGEPEVSPGPSGSFMKNRAIWRRQDYLELFENVAEEKAVGEASVVYLRSPIAAQRIHRNVPHAKIIAILRHPADRAHSHYWFHMQNGVEPAKSFEQALDQEARGLRDNWFSEFHHRRNGFYFQQLKRYYALFPREQIRVYLYEDWQAKPYDLLRDLFSFLEVDRDFTPTVGRSNVTHIPRVDRIYRWVLNLTALKKRLNRVLPPFLHTPVITGVQAYNRRYNQRCVPPLDPQTHTRLTQDYREDMLKLQDLVERDLTHWLKRPD
jgi:hypothetical protein